MRKCVNGKQVEMTEKEAIEFLAMQAKMQKEQEKEHEKEERKKQQREDGFVKLKAKVGLTDEEIYDLFD